MRVREEDASHRNNAHQGNDHIHKDVTNEGTT
jgi:hypothetical protein